MANQWNYSGDVNLCEGGLYWREDNADDYVMAVEITPCSAAGGPSNLFWYESGSIYLGDIERQNSALSVIGVEPEQATRRDYVEAMRAYYGIERDCYNGHGVIQIGARVADDADSRQWGGIDRQPDYVLRGNASLKRFVEREFLR